MLEEPKDFAIRKQWWKTFTKDVKKDRVDRLEKENSPHLDFGKKLRFKFLDEENEIESVTIWCDDAVYDVVLDAKGRELGAKMAGRKVEATGTIKEENNFLWLTVKTFKEVVEKKASEGKEIENVEKGTSETEASGNHRERLL